MEWDTADFTHRLVEKWKAGEEGQEEMINLRQKLLDFINFIDEKQKEMQEHQKKVEKVQQLDKVDVVVDKMNNKQKEEEQAFQVVSTTKANSQSGKDQFSQGTNPPVTVTGIQSGVRRKGQGSAPIQLLRSTRIRKVAVKFDPSNT
ncbi:hypothetical protein B9Z55_004973 [Caenorhabditis nigoni]|uniref:Uncharacterized protein n=1 Tax=Caenorhabditis nigoni TaxID=1611254 RepID=A0A2G5UZ48_9PELO|nr:hypothetical protein B9Z55_004973 [Caenorhabditis nigoni]